jgi:hypothetical protein
VKVKNDKTLLYGGIFYGLFVAAAVYWAGVWLEVSGSTLVRVGFAVVCGVLASLVFLLSYIAGKKRKKD